MGVTLVWTIKAKGHIVDTHDSPVQHVTSCIHRLSGMYRPANWPLQAGVLSVCSSVAAQHRSLPTDADWFLLPSCLLSHGLDILCQ
jgi:hypothetical protein